MGAHRERTGSLAIRIGSIVAALLAAIPITAAPASADGMSYRYDTALDSWQSLSERDQFCIINYMDGVEKMVISIQLDAQELMESDRMVWLVPIPAEPDEISQRLYSIVPRMNGVSAAEVLADKLAAEPTWMYCAFASQLYTLPVIGAFYVMTLGYGGSSGKDLLPVTHDRIEGYGLVSEVVAIEDSDGLNAYFASRNLSLPSQSTQHLGSYFGGSYSFVVSWLDNVSDFRSKATIIRTSGRAVYSIGVGLEFPSDGIFFPLRMTSAYGELEIPITVQVMGHVSVDKHPSGHGLNYSVQSLVQEDYEFNYYGHYPSYGVNPINSTKALEDYRHFFAEQMTGGYTTHLQNLEYTSVSVRGPSSSLSEDLWLVDSPDVQTSAMDVGIRFSPLVVIALFVVISSLTGLVTALLLFRRRSVSPLRFMFLGLFNVLSIVGVLVAFRLVDDRWVHFERWEQGLIRKARRKYTLGFSLIFLGITAGTYLAFQIVAGI